MLERIKGLPERWEPTAQLTERDISPHFWPNGTMPNSADARGAIQTAGSRLFKSFAHKRFIRER
jgi:hypothetical protein